MEIINIEKEKLLIKHCVLFSKNLALYRKRSKTLANAIINQDGFIDKQVLQNIIDAPIPPYGNAEHEAHIKFLARQLLQDHPLQKKILNFDFPITENFETFTRLALGLKDEILNKVHLRKAIVASLFGYLRQTVGSCFATAPCLYILKRHPDYFLEDLFLLSKKGSLQRISHGHMVEVPMTVSIGSHFLTQVFEKKFQNDSVLLEFINAHQISNLDPTKSFKDNLGQELALKLYAQAHDPILKMWEYTVASFCDAKGEFTESTIYLTLGLDAKEPDGLGEFFMNSFQQKLDKKHELLVQAQNEAYLAHQRLVMAETLAKNASTESSLQRSKSEMLAANYQLHARSLDVEELKKDQEKVKSLYDKQMFLIKENIPRFFQESYDPDLVSMKSYSEDAPAGFRLFVKDGKLSSRFSPINSEDDFIKALRQFFENIENELTSHDFDRENRQTISDVITKTIQFSSSKTFLEQTYLRAQKRHPKALPWAYVSGGTLETLLKTYFRKELLKIKTIESDTIKTFFIELVDYFKALPESFLEPFRINPSLSLLLETKTHACQLLPGRPFFRSLWESTNFTYTEIRDKIIDEGKKFYERAKSVVIPESFFQNMGKNLPAMSINTFFQTHPNPKESFYLVSSFLLSQIPYDQQEQTAGFCRLGDTNWTYSDLVIGYLPFDGALHIFAQDPDTGGLFHLDNMEVLPIKWKIYDDLHRVELFTPGIKI